MVETGTKAPSLTLPDAAGKTRRLSEFAGQWVVVYFYPRDDTPGCTREACDFTAGLAGLSKLDAVVLGVSPDSPESHAKFAAKHRLGVTLLSDPTHATIEAWGAWGEKTLYGKKSVGVIRSTVLVDPKGKVAWRWPRVRVDGHADAVRAKIAELRTA
jgi:peroxiredoxin Q/BCP